MTTKIILIALAWLLPVPWWAALALTALVLVA
jgi:hypothetical protein